jgi:hypothetical protein
VVSNGCRPRFIMRINIIYVFYVPQIHIKDFVNSSFDFEIMSCNNILLSSFIILNIFRVIVPCLKVAGKSSPHEIDIGFSINLSSQKCCVPYSQKLLKSVIIFINNQLFRYLLQV